MYNLTMIGKYCTVEAVLQVGYITCPESHVLFKGVAHDVRGILTVL